MEQRQRMALRKTFFVVCLIVSAFCLAGGYIITGQWLGVVLTIITGFAWLLARKYPDSGLPFICLLISICLAVVGILNGTPALIMISGSGFALAVWDLVYLDHSLGKNSSEEQTSRYEIKHLQSLALALGSGLSIVFLGRLLSLQPPFLMLVLIGALILFGLDRIWGYIKKAG